MSHRLPYRPEGEPAPAVRPDAAPARARTAVREATAGPTARARVALALLLALLATAWPRVASAQDAVAPEPPRDEVIVSGEGVVHGEPDQATLALGVEATDADARAVIEQTSRAMTRVQEALALHGIEERDVRTTTFDLYTERPHDAAGEALPERYRLVHMIEVTVRDVDAVGDVLADAVEAGANRVGGIGFGIADPSALEAEARRAAVEDATAKAEGLAEAAGRVLGEVLNIAETTAAPPARGGFDARMMSLEAASVPVASGQLAVQVHVSMVFELE